MPASSFVINITYDPSADAAPASFKAGIAAAVQYLESQFTDPVTINIAVGYGEVAGTKLGSGTLGSSVSNQTAYSYADVVAALQNDATSALDASVLASLPAASPVGNATIWLASAEAKALGMAAPGGALDGQVGFSSSVAFDYNAADGITRGAYDFNAIVLHEITEVMGRMMQAASPSKGYFPLDLLHYSAPGVRDLVQSTAGYFSPDGGATNMGNFNTNRGGDAADWASTMGNDAFNAFSGSGVVNAVSADDLAVMDAIGWERAGAQPPPPTELTGLVATALPYNAAAATGGVLRAGTPVASLAATGGPAGDHYQYALSGTGAANFAVTGTTATASLAVGPTAIGATSADLSLVVTDTESSVAAPAVGLGVIVGGIGGDTIGIAGSIGTGDTMAFIYGLDGNDTLDGSGATSALWIAGGAGADRMAGGSGPNTYAYGAASDSSASAMDIITNFNAAQDIVDLTGLGTALKVAGVLKSGKIAAGSIGWRASGGDTLVYVNTSNKSEKITGANMTIDLTGNVALTSADFHHV